MSLNKFDKAYIRFNILVRVRVRLLWLQMQIQFYRVVGWIIELFVLGCVLAMAYYLSTTLWYCYQEGMSSPSTAWASFVRRLSLSFPLTELQLTTHYMIVNGLGIIIMAHGFYTYTRLMFSIYKKQWVEWYNNH